MIIYDRGKDNFMLATVDMNLLFQFFCRIKDCLYVTVDPLGDSKKGKANYWEFRVSEVINSICVKVRLAMRQTLRFCWLNLHTNDRKTSRMNLYTSLG
jgi:hypothetical protein